MARTERSGSAMVISRPSTKHATSKSHSLRCLDRPEPTWVPIGVIARSAPMLNSPRPTISITALMVKQINSVPVRLNHGVSASRYTIRVIGRADSKDSLILMYNSFKIHHLLKTSFMFIIVPQEPGNATKYL